MENRSPGQEARTRRQARRIAARGQWEEIQAVSLLVPAPLKTSWGSDSARGNPAKRKRKLRVCRGRESDPGHRSRAADSFVC